MAAETEPPDAAEGALINDLREAFGFAGELSGSAERASAGSPAGSGKLGQTFAGATLAPGTRLGDFEILGELGRGGMGVVYRARQISLGRVVALKVLPGYARHGRLAVQRFRAEAQAAARLHHTNVVSIYAQGEHEGQFFYAMELVDGASLDTIIRSHPDLLSSTRARSGSSANWRAWERSRTAGATPGTPPADTPPAPEPPPELHWTRADYRHVAALLADVADALECAHQNGVIHRDVKPHNLLLGANNRLHLTDFGLARLLDEPHLTVSGEVMGTPAYLSPEQVRGKSGDIDHRTDIYSLGVTLYEVLTRSKPFDGDTREQIMTGILTTEPLAPRRLDPRIPIDLETICLRMLEKERGRRHPSAAVLADDLRRFAEGRPILSRRTSRLEKAAKWARRHKALTTAMAATATVLVLAAGLTWSVRSGQRRAAEDLLHRTYEQLVYVDYRTPELTKAKFDRAAALGVAPVEAHLIRAFESFGDDDPAEAVEHLAATLQRDPTDLRVLYLLSWAQHRNDEGAAARETFAQAEAARAAGAAAPADAWFFRGLAIHFEDSALAIESYQQAIALRAREYAFFPQAVLQLARARNQRAYGARTPDGLSEADAGLRQLIEQGHYKAYPYYLISITHKLQAEIYQGSTGTRDGLVEEHYAQALEWARRGQEVNPADDRPVTAEAECLESMGLWPEALAARTHAIELAGTDVKRCEGYHYRWRLNYWLGNLEAALADAEQHARCERKSRFYAHVYPALIQAEMGNLEAALEHARALANETPEDAQAVIWSAACLRLLGQSDEARTLLEERAAEVDYTIGLEPPQTAEWVRALYAYCLDGGPLDDLDALADETASPWCLQGEARFHGAVLRLAEGDREAALDGFWKSYRSFDGAQGYTYHARLIALQMEKDLAWPPWIKVSWSGVLDAFAGDDGAGVVRPNCRGEESS